MLENKEFYIELNDKIFKVELLKFSDTLNKALVFIPEKNRLGDVYVNELIIRDKEEAKVLPLTDEERAEYCDMYTDCSYCSGGYGYGRCPMENKNLSDERIEEIRMELIKEKEIK